VNKKEMHMKLSLEYLLWLPCGLFLVLVLLFITPRRANAQLGGGTQIVFDPSMSARQLQQLQQETQTVANEAQQLQYMIKNTTGGYAGVWQSSQSMLDELGGLIQQQGGLSYTLGNLQSQFQQQFPGYAVPQNPDQQEARNIATTLNTLNGTLVDAQSQAQNFANEQAQFAQLKGMNRTATGRLQAIQVGNEIVLQQAQQIQMLRQLVVAMINAQNVAAANAVNRQAAEDASTQQWLTAGPTVPFQSGVASPIGIRPLTVEGQQ
jgi:P-type conjugative transfer protein TrbJ